MDFKPRLQHLKPRHKFAALGVVAVAMVATPLVQVLRYQGNEIHAALHAQAGLDPLAGAVNLQHALLAHRDIAGLVLRGVLQLEPERSVRQGEVDDRTAALEDTLLDLKLPRAVSEARALRQDWATLAPQVAQRKISAADSDAAHRLLVEQALQVIDLVTAASGLGPHTPGEAHLASLRDLAPLPRVAAQIAALGPASAGSAARGDLVTAEAALARVLGQLSERTKGPGLNDAVLASAVARAGATADRLFKLRRHSEPPDPVALAAATQAALQAQARLFDAASQTVRAALAARVAHVEQQRAQWLTVMAALAALALALALALIRQSAPHRPQGSRPHGTGFDAEPDGQTLHRDVAGRLWQRLCHDTPGEHTAPNSIDRPASLPNQDTSR